jgi:hypothetical protein
MQANGSECRKKRTREGENLKARDRVCCTYKANRYTEGPVCFCETRGFWKVAEGEKVRQQGSSYCEASTVAPRERRGKRGAEEMVGQD